MSLKAKIEAVLFLTSKPIKAQTMARIVNAEVQSVRQALLELVHDYEERQGGLEIADDDGYSFQVKDQYASLMDEFLPVEMSAALIRTLSAIAIKQPIAQSEIIRIRGAGAYDHIRELVSKDLVAKKDEQGERSPTLSTTKKFQEYFKLSKDGKDLRNYLKRQVKKADAAAAADAAGQLAIPSMVAPEADDQLNQRIYLETADYTDDAPIGDVELVAESGSAGFQPALESGSAGFQPASESESAGFQPASELGSDSPASAFQVEEPTTSFAVPAAETPGARTAGPHLTPTPSAETTEPSVSAPAHAAAELDLTPAPSAAETPAPSSQAASTLSKLAEAAEEAKEPILPEGAGKSSVQAHSARKKEPKTAKNPPAKAKKEKIMPGGLTDLLAKQKLLELELKRGLLDDVIEDGSFVQPPTQMRIDSAQASD